MQVITILKKIEKEIAIIEFQSLKEDNASAVIDEATKKNKFQSLKEDNASHNASAFTHIALVSIP